MNGELFPELNSDQLAAIRSYGELLGEMTGKINLISAGTVSEIFERHIVPSLAIGRAVRFAAGTRLLDIGTGGGLPGIPLAIACPHCEFLLVDSVGKKARAVENFAKTLALRNVRVRRCRAEEVTEKFDFAIGRAVTPWPHFHALAKIHLQRGTTSSLSNGILYLGGGQRPTIPANLQFFPLEQLVPGLTCEDKWLVHCPIS